MKNNLFIKILCSVPVILVVLYFIPFLGICLLLFRRFVYQNKTIKTYILLLVCGMIILIPKTVDLIIKKLELSNIKITYLDKIISSGIYNNLLTYSRLLIILGVILIIASYIFKDLFNKLSIKLNSGIRNYMEQDLRKDYEIRKENDMKMQEKREKAKNTHVVYCPYCGADNMLTEKTGTCKFCRRKIEYKEKK